MLSPKLFFDLLKKEGIESFAGVPDSSLKHFCAYINDHCTEKTDHLICANEGGAIAFAIGNYLSTNKIPAVYMQNSGLGNAINPLLSIADPEVYSVPILLIIGWRGEPGHKDEPQHKKQGKVTLAMLKAMKIPYAIIDNNKTTLLKAIQKAISYMNNKRAPFALVVRKGIFDLYTPKKKPAKYSFDLYSKDAVKMVLDALDSRDIVISTTGLISREIYEYRDMNKQSHAGDFLNIGGMGHTSQIALGVAMQKPDRYVYCIDGDGAMIMHMGAMAINGTMHLANFRHILINNGSHNSVGGQPTVGFLINFREIARAAGYITVRKATTPAGVKRIMKLLKKAKGPSFFEICTNKGSGKNLGRPDLHPSESIKLFMDFLK